MLPANHRPQLRARLGRTGSSFPRKRESTDGRAGVGKMMTALLILACIALPALTDAWAQRSGKPLAKEDVIGLLKGEVPPERVAQVARDQGISFPMTGATERELRDAGADDGLIEVLRGLAPKPAAPPHTEEPAPPPRSSGPPVLMIDAQPGNAQVYVDDEPVGTTSSEGRLKLSRLSAGSHLVRLSHARYQDYEQDVTLQGGQTATVSASLVARQAAQPPPASANTQPSGGDAASLGVLMSTTPPASGRGVMISDVVPGGPADRAGLRTGYTILRIEGRNVGSASQVQQALAAMRVGTVADVTYNDGSTVRTTGVRLGSRAALMPGGGAQGVSGSAGTTGTMSNATNAGVVSFLVEHDHGQTGRTFCVGIMIIGNGRLQYRSTTGVHSFDLALSDIREVKRNALYLAAIGAFHIRLRRGTTYNFAVVNAQGVAQPPDPLLEAVDRAMGQR
ncbi:MAG: PEGA domain-containing protein [Acidobacteriia bacterium]|nr:PEGA domain-containing protein [Terriglobia bacterium]